MALFLDWEDNSEQKRVVGEVVATLGVSFLVVAGRQRRKLCASEAGVPALFADSIFQLGPHDGERRQFPCLKFHNSLK